jgi:DDE superfamily endonuclease/Winged helix-turn helix
VIERLTGVRYHPAWVWAVLHHRLGWTVQRPRRRAAERDHITAGNYDTDSLIEVMGELRRFLGGEKATLLWDGLPAHRSRAMRAWLATQRHWLVVERLPAYAPELNPTEGLWSSLKAVELANLCGPTLAEVIAHTTRHPANPNDPPSGLLVPAPDRPVSLMSTQPDTQNPLSRPGRPASGAATRRSTRPCGTRPAAPSRPRATGS